MAKAPTPFEPTTLGFAILGLLSHGAMSGYQVRRQFERTAIARYSSSPGSIYPALRRLQGEGLIAQPKVGAPFELTPKGRALLQEWLLRPVTRADMEQDDGVLMLRFAFMTDLVPRAAVRAFLTAFGKEAAAQAARLEASRRGEGVDLPLCAGLAVDRGIEGYRANVRWAKTALKKVGMARASKSAPVKGGKEKTR
jgi:DNA-binding PadR family transcriptional regulator